MTASGREPDIAVLVSWDGSGEFDEVIDDITDRLLKASLTVSSGRDEVSGNGRPKILEFAWESNNEDRQLSNFLASSDRYRLVKPGKPAQIRMAGGTALYADALPYAGSWYWEGRASVPIATGTLKSVRQRTRPGDKAVSFSAVGRMARLQDTRISTPLYTAIRTDQAISYILDAVGWPAGDRDLALGDTTLLFWWLDDEEPMSALADLLDTEGIPAAVFERGDGTLVFQNRNWRGTATRSAESQCTFFDLLESGRTRYADDVPYAGAWAYGSGPAPLYHSGVEDDPSYEDIFNAATMTVRRRAVQSLQKVWEYGTTLSLSAGQTLDVTAVLPEPSSGAVAPASGTDYTVSVGSLASAPTIVAANAQRVTIRFVAGGGGATVIGVTSNGPQLRATPATVVSESQAANSIDASDSIAENGGVVRTLQVAARQEISQASAITLCDAAVVHHQFQRSRIRLTVKNIDAVHLGRQLTLETSDRISVQSTQLGYGIAGELGDFWVEQKELRRVDEGLDCVLSCQQVLPEAGGALWDDGLWESGLWAR